MALAASSSRSVRASRRGAHELDIARPPFQHMLCASCSALCSVVSLMAIAPAFDGMGAPKQWAIESLARRRGARPAEDGERDMEEG